MRLQEYQELLELLEDALNYVEQAQIIVINSDRYGASILASMGSRLVARLQEVIPSE